MKNILMICLSNEQKNNFFCDENQAQAFKVGLDLVQSQNHMGWAH
jgi:hypothetical protein